jgi:tetratricopeptide (TPR) repeat protein
MIVVCAGYDIIRPIPTRWNTAFQEWATVARKRVSKGKLRRAADLRTQGLEAYQDWDVERAVDCLEGALGLVPEDTDCLLDLARVLARSGDFDRALKTLAEFLRLEPDSPLAERLVQLYASGMDGVEQVLTSTMTRTGVPLGEVGSAIQMWLEYRIALGREPLNIRKPETWAAALDYTVRKVNVRQVTRREIADLYGISDSALRDHHNDLVSILDVMPCDYRYFAGEDNPLDKLVEAAELLEELEAQFRAA